MSITAIVRDVRYNDDGTATLLLDPYKGDGPGQAALVVENPNPHLRGLIGLLIWGGDCGIIHRNTIIADRISYTRIRLRDPSPAACSEIAQDEDPAKPGVR